MTMRVVLPQGSPLSDDGEGENELSLYIVGFVHTYVEYVRTYVIFCVRRAASCQSAGVRNKIRKVFVHGAVVPARSLQPLCVLCCMFGTCFGVITAPRHRLRIEL